jgi:hypothetical protein
MVCVSSPTLIVKAEICKSTAVALTRRIQRRSLVLVEDKRCLENHSGTSSTISEHVAIVPLHFPTSFKLTSSTPTPNTIERPAACLLVVTARRSIARGVRTDDLMVLEVTTDLLDEDATFARNGVSASLDQLQHIAVSDGPALPGVQAEFGTTGVFVFDEGLSGWRHH